MSSYISNRAPMAYMSRAKTELQIKPSPYVASFSSRGPNLLEQAILKVIKAVLFPNFIFFSHSRIQ